MYSGGGSGLPRASRMMFPFKSVSYGGGGLLPIILYTLMESGNNSSSLDAVGVAEVVGMGDHVPGTPPTNDPSGAPAVRGEWPVNAEPSWNCRATPLRMLGTFTRKLTAVSSGV